MKNAKFYKREINNVCWFCDGKSDGILVYRNGDEIPICKVCSAKEIKTVRKSKQPTQSNKISNNHEGNSGKDAPVALNSDTQSQLKGGLKS